MTKPKGVKALKEGSSIIQTGLSLPGSPHHLTVIHHACTYNTL